MPARADYGKKTTTAAMLLGGVRKFSSLHGRCPTIGEMEVSFGVMRRVINDKLRMLRQLGEVDMDGDTIIPIDDLPPAGPVTTYYMSRGEIASRYGAKGVGA